MRIILKCNRYTSSINTMLNTLNFLNVKETIYYNSLVMIFKIRNNFAPEYLKEKLKYINEGGYYDLRGGENFKINVCKTNRKFKTLFYSGLSEYNTVPREIKKCSWNPGI